MRTSRLRVAAAVAAATGMLALPAGSLAAKPAATFKGRTSQGKTIVVQYLKNGSQGVIRFKTTVVGICPVQGFGANATESEHVSDVVHGAWPIPSKWGWETTRPTYDIKIRSTGRRKLSGQLIVSWQTNIDNMPSCQTPTISWKAKRH